VSLGIVLGVKVSFSIGTLAGLPSSITPQSVLLGALIGVLTTTVTGVYPANKAAKLDPNRGVAGGVMPQRV
jgi:putative ABC transport system permease protein